MPAGVVAAVRGCWSAETAAPGQWDPSLPAAGQCAVTALVLQDLFGGTLIRTTVGGRSHYWNRIGGVDVDLTREQFPTFVPDAAPQPRERRYLLASPSTAGRYLLLRRRVRRAMPS